jgi:hypothetical protein
MARASIRLLFAIAGVYDFVIGLAFLVAGARIFDAAGVPHPNHWGYIQFASLLVITFGMMFFAIAYDPASNRNLIPYGMLLKLSYTAVVGYYWIRGDCPALFKPFAIIDAVMFILFVLAYVTTGRSANERITSEQDLGHRDHRHARRA